MVIATIDAMDIELELVAVPVSDVRLRRRPRRAFCVDQVGFNAGTDLRAEAVGEYAESLDAASPLYIT